MNTFRTVMSQCRMIVHKIVCSDSDSNTYHLFILASMDSSYCREKRWQHGNMALMVAMLVSWLVWNISQLLDGLKFWTDTHGPQRSNPNNVGDCLTFPLVPPAGQNIHFSLKSHHFPLTWMGKWSQTIGPYCISMSTW